MKRNVADLIKLREIAKNSPESLDMGQWGQQTACGTTMCLAGHKAVTLDGLTPLWKPCIFGERDETGQYRDQVVMRFSEVVNDAGDVLDVEDYAREELGLTWDEAQTLFFSNNSTFLRQLDHLIETGDH